MHAGIDTISTLHDLLGYQARTFCSAEMQLKKSLAEWIDAAAALKLKIVLQSYRDFVVDHLQKMESFFAEQGISSFYISNRIMHACIEETDIRLKSCSDGEVKDACLLSAVQAINHFKISLYGTSAAFALSLGMEKSAQLFHEAEISEKQIDNSLSQLAVDEINNRAKPRLG